MSTWKGDHSQRRDDVPEKIRKYSPPISEINAIPMDWKNLDSQTLKQFQDEFKEIFK